MKTLLIIIVSSLLVYPNFSEARKKKSRKRRSNPRIERLVPSAGPGKNAVRVPLIDTTAAGLKSYHARGSKYPDHEVLHWKEVQRINQDRVFGTFRLTPR